MKTENVVFDSRDDACYVLAMLRYKLKKRGYVRLKDYYKYCYIAELEDNTDPKYGWRDLSNVRLITKREFGGTYYIVELPDVIEL